ncbi:macrosialin isoform X1 [Talpa occidentalis]|uniref:macrosialin isoform X1 n=1 Tax=Talpa occidentalis TaxID=50954 RepID=UPI00188FF7DF|nr:macrosialin isoform X1 [Talpa occidentalis]
MRLAVLFTGVLLGLLAGQGTGNDCPHKKSATLLPSFTVTPTATASTRTISHRTTKSHRTTTTRTTSQKPTTPTHHTTTTSQKPTTPTHHTTTTSQKPTTPTHHTNTTSHGNITVHPTTDNSTTTSPGFSPYTGPPLPPSPSPSPGSSAIGKYTWFNGTQPCVRLHAQIQIRILYTTKTEEKAWGMSVLNPNKTEPQGGCNSTHPQLLLSFPYGQLSFGFKQDPEKNTVYLNYMAAEYNVSFSQAAESTFSVKNSSLQDLQAPLGHSFRCENASIALSPTFHLDLLSLRLQAAQVPPRDFGPSVFCTSNHSILLPLIIGLILLGLLTLVLVTFCIIQRRPPSYQAL